MSITEAAESALEGATAELAGAEIQLIEATARAEVAREAVLRLQNAVAALNGTLVENPLKKEDYPPIAPPVSAERKVMQDMTPEQFDAERKRKQRAREKEEIANNPLGHLKCPGCGDVGKLTDAVMTTKGGGTVRMLTCGGCGNQQLSG